MTSDGGNNSGEWKVVTEGLAQVRSVVCALRLLQVADELAQPLVELILLLRGHLGKDVVFWSEGESQRDGMQISVR